jgi:hypothetical protein
MNCPRCSAALAERGSFCKACGVQARCRNCKDVLEPDAVACVECGTLVGTSNGNGASAPESSSGAQPAALPANRNTITWREDRNSRDFQASLTDESMQTVGGFFGELFANRVSKPSPGTNRLFTRDQHSIDITHQLTPPEQEAHHTPPPPSTETDDKVRIGKLFRENGQTLNLIDRRLKAKSAQDAIRRLTYLFLYANELHGRYSTLRSDVIAVLKEGKIWDSNASTWLKKKIGFKVDSEERMELLGEGRDDAKKYLVEALDPSIADDWTPDKKGTVKRAPRKKKP